MKKFSILIQLRFIYIYFLLYILVGYFYESKLKINGFYEFLEEYFGYSLIFIVLILLLDICSFFIRCKKRKMVYNIRVKFFTILVISSIFLWGMYLLNLPFQKIVADNIILENSIKLFVYKYKLGVILPFLLNYCLTKIYFNYFYVTLYVLIFISLFFLVAKKIRTTITNFIINRRERKKREIERKLIQEQIELMEALERKEREKQEMESEEIELESECEVEVIDEKEESESIVEEEKEKKEDDISI